MAADDQPIADMWLQGRVAGNPGTKPSTCTKAIFVCDHEAQEACKKKFGKKTKVEVTLPSGRKIWQWVWEADQKTCPLNCSIKHVPIPCPLPEPKKPPPGCDPAGKNCCGLYHNDKNDPKDVGKYGCWHAQSATNCAGFANSIHYSNVAYCGK
ncbi:MAG: hypothetical protein FJ100_07450 [Deltaproteobacteria bacterium]|nr:hypothetical protein [Deltaproteobacteria bacterium]